MDSIAFWVVRDEKGRATFERAAVHVIETARIAVVVSSEASVNTTRNYNYGRFTQPRFTNHGSCTKAASPAKQQQPKQDDMLTKIPYKRSCVQLACTMLFA